MISHETLERNVCSICGAIWYGSEPQTCPYCPEGKSRLERIASDKWVV